MVDEGVKFDILTVRSDAVSWRIFERECMEKYFGQSIETKPEGIAVPGIHNKGVQYVYWKIHTESTDIKLLNRCCQTAGVLERFGIKHINNPHGWINSHAKEAAFKVWEREKIPCPKWFQFDNQNDFAKKATFSYPMLIRLNNSTSGWFSELCYSEAEVMQAIPKVLKGMQHHHDKIPNTGVDRKMIAVQYIPTTRPEGVNLSFRIIVAGNRVVVGYARLGQPKDWVVITGKFETWMQKPFVHYQKVCQKFCEENEALIVKAVKCLGLNFQGVDVILDQKDNPYFIEVQPGFSVGYPNRSGWKPPFYNPSKPPALLDFLHKNLDMLEQECPMYANLWLDKYKMFDKAFKSLKEDLG